MWVIKMKFVGKDKTYSIEEESATDAYWADIKYKRMLRRWHNILCHDCETSDDFLLVMIEHTISSSNNGSTFDISMEEI
jgi:hypothetical protein